MADLNELNLPNEELARVIDPDELPAQGRFKEPLQPGDYTFKLPQVFRGFESIVGFQNEPQLEARFIDEFALVVPALNEHFNWKVNTIPRLRGKDKIPVSDFAYLLKALEVRAAGNTLKDLAQALLVAVEQQSTFKGTVKWGTKCSESKDVYKDGAVQAGVKGCGRKYSTDPYTTKKSYGPNQEFTRVFPIPQRQDGTYSPTFECACGATLRSWPEIDRIR